MHSQEEEEELVVQDLLHTDVYQKGLFNYYNLKPHPQSFVP